MQVSISTRHGDVSADTQQKIVEKAQKLPRFFDRLTAIEVTVDLERHDSDNVGVELRASAEHAEDFVARDTGANILAALDGALHKIEKQLRKHKEKLTGHRQPGLKHLETETEEAAE
ncbi:ribosome hibernation-promoting factor, HPF/YfiA family [Lignipirellula cremea]|uniref:Ribosome hibernation promoting factor n=1 Tax=Lignipirellula cremea TaxID=2528010 RepID=A0A518DNW8_9BACT|nr:ribosome-associated translation inhibitor RaiA [Lignipirellula cremea]QDU93503.1 Ribosome hibernation promoting factor [Lignipirellula cremea]